MMIIQMLKPISMNNPSFTGVKVVIFFFMYVTVSCTLSTFS